MDRMPDELLLVVLRHLDVKELFVCRLVCRRFSFLALHPDAWRHRSLADGDPHASTVLHLAPCLQNLYVSSNDMTLQLTTTNCAVTSLSIMDVGKQGSATAMAYSLVIRNQESLGRLTSLELVWPIAADILARTVATSVGLQSLKVVRGLEIMHPVTRGPSRPSLTYFKCQVDDDNSKSFVNTILAGHIRTLEDVDLGVDYSCSDDSYATARLLGAMPNLRRLSCSTIIPGLQAVAACRTLRELTLSIYPDATAIGEAAEFLRRAVQLRKVKLDFSLCEREEFNYQVLVPVLVKALTRALTSSLRPLLEGLSLNCYASLRLLLRCLHRLPGLRYLDVAEAPSMELLLQYNYYSMNIPARAPALRTLKLGLYDVACTHSWLHRVKGFLNMNPLLHLQLLFGGCNRNNCKTCALDCHREVTSSKKWRKLGLFSHAPDLCPSPDDHPISHDTVWVHM